jgi:hypothetical protein
LRGSAKFRKRIDVGGLAGNEYRVKTTLKGNSRYFPGHSRFRGCTF